MHIEHLQKKCVKGDEKKRCVFIEITTLHGMNDKQTKIDEVDALLLSHTHVSTCTAM